MVVRSWIDQAACRGRSDVNWDSDLLLEQHREICSRCPVSEDCLTTALSHRLELDVGIWAATTPRDRRALRQTGRVWKQTAIAYGDSRV